MNKTPSTKIIIIIIIILAAVGCILGGFKLYDYYQTQKYPLKYAELINKYSDQYNLDKHFVSAIINTESSFNPDAESSAGAQGLMQIVPDTAEWIAGKLGKTDYDMFDPEQNIEFGCWYLNFLQERFSDRNTVAAAYNAGHGIVAKWLENKEYSDDGITLKNIPYNETSEYVKKISQAYEKYREIYEDF